MKRIFTIANVLALAATTYALLKVHQDCKKVEPEPDNDSNEQYWKEVERREQEEKMFDRLAGDYD